VKPNSTLNNTETPSGLDLVETSRILTHVDEGAGFAERIAWICEYFLGRPYVEGSLGGGPDLPEKLSVSLEAFDCVTYIEVVLALARSQTTDEFVDAIRRIRYKDGKVDWFHRNHYMVDWAQNNEKLGLIANLTAGPLTAHKACTLDLIAGLPAKTTTFSYFPNQSLDAIVERIETGDLIFFVSIRTTLDVFHTGLLAKREGKLRGTQVPKRSSTSDCTRTYGCDRSLTM
jgi:N-acetylmuramoyl-L-alanine amidase-like protein